MVASPRCAVLLIGALLTAPALSAPTQAAPVKNRKVEALGGGRVDLLVKKRVNVLFFFRLDQTYSREGLQALTALQKKVADKPVRFLALVSDRYPVVRVKALLAATKSKVAVARDVKDKLYSELRIRMEPMAVFISKQGKVVGSQAFRKINFVDDMVAWLRHALGEIDAAQLQAILEPKARKRPGTTNRSPALRYQRLARMLLGAGSLDGARKAIDKSLADDAKLADSHVILGEILVAQKKCAEAKKAFKRARALDPKLAAAKKGACR